MENWQEREELLIGKDNIDKLKNATVAVFGCGGVGSYTVEALARAGIGNFVLVDKDVVDVTNINRQLVADFSTIGRDKVEVEKERILRVNPDAKVEIYKEFYCEENKEKLKELLVNHEVDIITFTSSSTVFNLVDQLDGKTGLLDGVSLACIGPITADACRKYGLEPQIISDTFTIDGLTEAIVKGVAKE